MWLQKVKLREGERPGEKENTLTLVTARALQQMYRLVDSWHKIKQKKTKRKGHIRKEQFHLKNQHLFRDMKKLSYTVCYESEFVVNWNYTG